MKFLSVCPELGTVTFGIPQFSEITNCWFVGWYRESGMKTALTRPSPKELKWILANKTKIEAIQRNVDAWLAGLWTSHQKH